MRPEMHSRFRLNGDELPQAILFRRQKGSRRMTKRGKSASSRIRRRSAREAKGDEGAFNTADISDRLYNVMAELFVVSDAVAGSELQDPKSSGLRMILHRQIEEISSLKDIIHPWTPTSPKEIAS